VRAGDSVGAGERELVLAVVEDMVPSKNQILTSSNKQSGNQQYIGLSKCHRCNLISRSVQTIYHWLLSMLMSYCVQSHLFGMR
jgi:hypothetical protein